VTWNHPRSRRIPQTHLQPAVFIEEISREIKRVQPFGWLFAIDNGRHARYFKTNK